MGYNNSINNTILGTAGFGTTPVTTTQAAVSPSISTGSITTGLLVNPIYSPSSVTSYYGEQITPQFNPDVGNTFAAIYGLSVAPGITPSGGGLVTTAYGLNITGPTVTTGAITSAYSLFVTNPSGAGTITNAYTAILGTTNSALVGVGTSIPAYTLDIAGPLSVHRLTAYGLPLTTNNQLVSLSQGYNQGGVGGGSVGTNKQVSLNTATVFDLSNINATCKGFWGAVFDGRYIYLVPNNNGAIATTVARYDTTQPFASANSYTTYDVSAIAIGLGGFKGGLFDGRYVYYVPNYPGTSYSGTILRYDSTLSFTAATSYTTFDMQRVSVYCVSYNGGAFDGRYLYFTPLYYLAPSGTVARYDTTLSFTTVSSYTSFNLTSLNPGAVQYFGAVYDGRYVYFVPNNSNGGYGGTIARYDTTLSFSASSSWTLFDMLQLSSTCKGFSTGVFDGRYVYFVPYNNGSTTGTAVRYDSTLSFTATNSYTVFDMTRVSSYCKGFFGGVYDGRYVYFAPYSVGATLSGTVVRYDTTLSFVATSSYTILDVTPLNANSRGFIGAIFDGRYVYFVPNGGTSSGAMARLDAYPGPQATALAASGAPNGFVVGTYVGTNTPPTNGMIISGNVGIGTSSPAYALDVVGSINALALSGAGLNIYATGGTTRNQLITLAQGYTQGGFGSSSVGTNKPMSIYTTSIFDASQISANITAINEAVFDGRYIYFISTAFYYLTRYDTTLSFSATSSYTVFNGSIFSNNQYYSGVFDGRYVYFVPFGDAVSGSGWGATVLRYDTTQSFTAYNGSNYTTFNTLTLAATARGYLGAVFDGRYIYYVPNGGDTLGLAVRYDTTLSFTTTGSYATFDLPTALNANVRAFAGGVFDGRYVYFVPFNYSYATARGTIARYDTTQSFVAAASWTIFDSRTNVTGHAGSYYSGVFDGRYVYYTPTNCTGPTYVSVVLRYDTQQSFTNSASYLTFDVSTVDANSKSFRSSVFDGRYVYFIPENTSTNDAGTIIRYDTTRSFIVTASWTAFSALRFSANCKDYGCGIYDGRYIYLVPNNGGTGSIIVRIDAYPGTQAADLAASQAPNGFAIGSYAGVSAPPSGGMIVSGQVGIGTASPATELDVNGTINAISTNYFTSQTYATGGTTRNQLITLAQGYSQGGFGGGSVGTNKTMSINSTTVFDLTTVTGIYALPYGGVFDGRYIYLVPTISYAAGDQSGTMTRYDTTLPFGSLGSYTIFDMSQVNTYSRGFGGGCFDGRYAYFAPYRSGSVFTRYDTTRSFFIASSYTTFDVALVSSGYSSMGAVFDGRYVYLVPNSTVILTRYDTTLPFNLTSSYTIFSASTAFPGETQSCNGGIYDGRYLYYSPNGTFGNVVRYDTTSSFTTSSSFTTFNLTSVNAGVNTLYGACFDGRYIYYSTKWVNSSNGLAARYDTTQPFRAAGSYIVFDISNLSANAYGFAGNVYDGRYVYYVPLGDPSVPQDNFTVARYDTTLSYAAMASWTLFSLASLSSSARGLTGALYDGKYVYFFPNYISPGIFVRLDAYPGPQAMAMAASQAPEGFAVGSYAGTVIPSSGMIIQGNVGIGTSSPQYTLDVNGTVNAISMNVANLPTNQPFAGTANNQLITLATGFNQGGFGGGSVGTNIGTSRTTGLAFNTNTVDSNIGVYQGALFDGRYVYLIPADTINGKLTRYDTTLPFMTNTSYTAFNMLTLNANAKKFAGGAFDGRYIYLAPQDQTTGIVVRYDTTQGFNTSVAYTIFDARTTLNTWSCGFQGAVFDGRYIYFVPYSTTGGVSGTISRYDTTLSFTTVGSWTTFNSTGVSGSSSGFVGGAFDGRYVYYVPSNNGVVSGTVTRYDTTRSFTTIGSYSVYDMAANVNSYSKGFYGAVFDGRYIYYVMWSTDGTNGSGTLTRYDTTQAFSSASSYTTTSVSPLSGALGFIGGVFDGRYVYYIGYGAGSSHTRYDTTQPFNSLSSYTLLDMLGVASGYWGGVYDGRYVYFVQYNAGTGTYISRYNAYAGPQATAIAASQAPNGFAVGTYAGTTIVPPNNLLIYGQLGVGTSSPQYNLQLGDDSAGKPNSANWFINSDIRIKRNIQDVPNALDAISRLRPRKFQFISEYAKDTKIDPNKTYYGFIADEVENVIEGCVHTSTVHCYGGKMRKYFDNGASGPMPSPLPGLMNLKSFNIHNIYIYYIQAIKELADLQNRLQKEIDDLKKSV
jgi:hypothetical protein